MFRLMGKGLLLSRLWVLYAVFDEVSPGEVVDGFLLLQCAFNGVVCRCFHHPFKIILSHTGELGVGCRIAEIDGIWHAVSYGQLHRVEVITERRAYFEDDLFQFLVLFRAG